MCTSDTKIRSQPLTDKPPIEMLLDAPTTIQRYTCVSILIGIIALWCKYSFIGESETPDGIERHIHSWKVPITISTLYLISLPLLRIVTEKYLSKMFDMKTLLTETMILYNASQVVINAWTVYAIVDGLLFRGHQFVGGPIHIISTGAPYAVYVHYMDKYLEYLDTYFMVLRGKNDQVSFLHVYHHASICIAWWAGLRLIPSGDSYFGALLNSTIHVLMYSYYTLSLLKISCPWKKYLTQCQLIQFISVVLYSIFSTFQIPPGTHWTKYFSYLIQVFEMVSLFVFFSLFYKKAYNNKKPSSKISSSTSASSDSKGELESLSSVGTED